MAKKKEKSSSEKIEVTVPAAAPAAVPAPPAEQPVEAEAPVWVPVDQAAKVADDYANHPKFSKFKSNGGL